MLLLEIIFHYFLFVLSPSLSRDRAFDSWISPEYVKFYINRLENINYSCVFEQKTSEIKIDGEWKKKLEAYIDEILLIASTESEAHRIEKLNVKSSIVMRQFIHNNIFINCFGRCWLQSHYKFSFRFKSNFKRNRISKTNSIYIFIHNEHLIISLGKNKLIHILIEIHSIHAFRLDCTVCILIKPKRSLKFEKKKIRCCISQSKIHSPIRQRQWNHFPYAFALLVSSQTDKFTDR